jgi:hypothetical protein
MAADLAWAPRRDLFECFSDFDLDATLVRHRALLSGSAVAPRRMPGASRPDRRDQRPDTMMFMTRPRL